MHGFGTSAKNSLQRHLLQKSLVMPALPCRAKGSEGLLEKLPCDNRSKASQCGSGAVPLLTDGSNSVVTT